MHPAITDPEKGAAVDHESAGTWIVDYSELDPGSKVRAAIVALDRFAGPIDRGQAADLLPRWWRAPALSAEETAAVLRHFPERRPWHRPVHEPGS